MRTLCLSVAAAALFCSPLALAADAAGAGAAATPAPAADATALKKDIADLIARAENYLLAQQQANGAFVLGGRYAIGVTALAVDALASGPASLKAGDPRLDKAIAFLLSHQKPNGGIYADEEGLGNYGTAITLMALASAGAVEKHAAEVKRMQDYLFGIQNTEAGSIFEGGIGYGSRGKGSEDLSNTAMAVEGLRRSGVPADNANLQKAMKFLERCQDLSSVNKAPWVQNTGGAVYTPDESKAGGSWSPEVQKAGDPPPRLEPYGGMTYQLISSYIALDLKPEDPRVKAALDWVKRNYRFDANPGMQPGKERQGLFYYYMTMAKTFDLMDATSLQLADGRTVDWRADLFQAIRREATEIALPDGSKGVSWINSADRWAEGMPHVTSGYLIKTLKRIHSSL